MSNGMKIDFEASKSQVKQYQVEELVNEAWTVVESFMFIHNAQTYIRRQIRQHGGQFRLCVVERRWYPHWRRPVPTTAAELAEEHRQLVHSDGSDCPDGCGGY